MRTWTEENGISVAKYSNALIAAILTVVMALALTAVIGLSTDSVWADTDTVKEYQITLSAGNHGTLEGGKTKIVIKARPNEEVNLSSYVRKVTLEKNSKYYVKGIRVSGHDNSEAVTSPVFTASRDQDFVIAYGIKGEQVAYTVTYKDENGKTLAPSETFYGNVGDKPVVTYYYVDGYVPQAVALTKTLSSNASENQFGFVYKKGATTTTQTTTQTRTTVVTVTNNVAGGNGTNANNNGNGNGNNGDNGNGNGDNGNAAGDNGNGGNTIDLDDPDTPAGQQDLDKKGLPWPMVAGLVITSLALLAILLFFLLGRRRKEQAE